MKIGINTFLFTSPFTNASTELFPKFKEWGFDSVEIALEDPSHIDPAFVKAELDANGLTCGSICGAFGPDRDLRGDPQQQQTSIAYQKGLIDAAVVLECPRIIGPVYSAVGRAEYVPDDQRPAQWASVVRNLKEICAYAAERNILICLEPLNRFETDFINTCDQALQMVHDVASPALKVHLDTFHMNIEEKNSADAIRRAGPLLAHFHACGSDRGTPGGDHIDWKSIAAALKEVGYSGEAVIESFTPDVLVIAKAASIWRMMEPRREDIAINGVRFLREILH